MFQPKFPAKAIPVEMPENAITERIIKCAITVHRELGPDLLESVYEEALSPRNDINKLSVSPGTARQGRCVTLRPI